MPSREEGESSAREAASSGVSLASAGAIALTALGMVLTPGPNMIYLVPRSISQGRAAFESQRLRRDPPIRLFRMGLATNLLNPKAAIMYLALIPQFIDPAGGNTTSQGFTLGAIQIVISMIVNAAIIGCAATIAGFLEPRPSWILWQRRITGTMLGLVTIVLAREVPERACI